MGMFGKRIAAEYGRRAAVATQGAPGRPDLAILSPWAPQDTLVTWAIDDALGGLLDRPAVMTRAIALRIPGVKRAHGINCSTFAGLPFFQNTGDQRTANQPQWLTSSDSGVSPYHRMYGMASDWFFDGWALLGFTEDRTDALHIPFGMWRIDPDTGVIEVTDERVPVEYTAQLVAIPLGYGENGLMVDGVDTLNQARRIEASYQDRLDNPIPLTVIKVPAEEWKRLTAEERQKFRDNFVRNRRTASGSTVAISSDYGLDMPGQVPTDLYETGRNGVRIDIANHTALPASAIEGVRQGGSGGGTEMRYQGVGEGGIARSDMWDFGLPKRMVAAFEARMSLDDICPPGDSIRADLSSVLSAPNPTSNPTSED